MRIWSTNKVPSAPEVTNILEQYKKREALLGKGAVNNQLNAFIMNHLKDNGVESHLIEVIDNGIWISKEMSNKIFEPYFTTKNKGTWLGLSIVKKIIEDHNGKIKIEKNKQMAGTTSIITFENTNA